MHYYFLTAIRNEAKTLDSFITEFSEIIIKLKIQNISTLVVVDDYSTDDSLNKLKGFKNNISFELRLISVPTNLGNQGAMFFGLQHLDLKNEDILVTFDADGEDDISSFPELLQLAKSNREKVIYVERASRTEGLFFKFLFAVYKIIFRFFSGSKIVPNNVLLIPGKIIPTMKNTILCSAHFGYGLMRLNLPHEAVSRSRRPRYSGKSSQNLYNLISHGLVGLMIFYESALGKMFSLSLIFILISLVLKTIKECITLGSGIIGIIVTINEHIFFFLGVMPMLTMIAAALALLFKVSLFMSQSYTKYFKSRD
jgi:glycosyltransferase involved in cell wall biosynthesis